MEEVQRKDQDIEGGEEGAQILALQEQVVGVSTKILGPGIKMIDEQL